MNQIEERTRRTKWFLHDRFGMFIHWGLYAIPARGEWVRSVEKISTEDYQPYFDSFDPVDYDPKKWAKAAKAAGMQYAVLTAKHHDGFCLFDSKLTDYKATNTKAGRDLVREYVDAFRAEGLKVGLYYSIIDWHHPDFPHYGDRQHPMRDCEAEKAREAGRNFENYLTYMHGQVRELCENYGKIDVLWFDFSYDDMRGEKWRATDLINMVRSLQPDVIIDNRLEASGDSYGTVKTLDPSVYAGDFASPEQIIPPEGIVNEAGDPVPWEACVTMNNNWGYNSHDHMWKSPKLILRKLVECVSKNGNLLLNVGPDARGNIPAPSMEILSQIGEWMGKNGQSIYGCGRSELPKPEWGYFTQKGDRLYAHIFDGNIGSLAIGGVKERVLSMRLLRDGSEVLPIDTWNVKEYPESLFVNFGDVPTNTYPLPDDIDTVVELTLRGDC